MGRMEAGRRLLIIESGDASEGSESSRPVQVGQVVTVGRDGDARLGVDVADLGISRVAVTVTATGRGWNLHITNRNGAVLHFWGHPPLPATGHMHVTWPLVALRIRGDAALEHWVLLESPELAALPEGPVPGATEITTYVHAKPPPLTPPQVEALHCMFADVLRWPPVSTAMPLQLKQVASRLNVTTEAVQQRLRGARAKAVKLGMSRTPELGDPEYLYVLVRSGYLSPPMQQSTEPPTLIAARPHFADPGAATARLSPAQAQPRRGVS